MTKPRASYEANDVAEQTIGLASSVGETRRLLVTTKLFNKLVKPKVDVEKE